MPRSERSPIMNPGSLRKVVTCGKCLREIFWDAAQITRSGVRLFDSRKGSTFKDPATRVGFMQENRTGVTCEGSQTASCRA